MDIMKSLYGLLSEEHQIVIYVFLQNISENYLVLSYVPIFLLGLLLFEGIRRIKKTELVNNTIIIVISCMFIYFLDSRSFFVLLTLAILVFLGIKLRLNYRQHLLLVAAAIIISLIGVKIVLASFTNPIILLGFSYYFFRLGSVIIENGRGNKEYSNVTAHRFFAYVFFFPIFLAGPVQRLHNFYPVNVANSDTPKLYFFIICLLLVKLSLIDIFLNGSIILPTREFLLPEISQLGFTSGFFLLLFHGSLSLLNGYIDLLIYTRLAITVGRLLGYHIMQDFNRPFLATNIADYWRRWHISITTWVRDYIYFPLMLKLKKPWLATYASMLTIGLWHTANLNWVFFALCHGTALNFYTFLTKQKVFKTLLLSRFGNIFLIITGWIVTIGFVSLVYNLVAFTDYSKSWEIIMSLNISRL